MINVTIIGFGNVGSALTSLMLNNKHAIRINILDPNDQCSGAFLDLQHGMSLFPTKELHVNDMELFTQSDFVFFTAGTPNVNGGSRLDMAQQNSELARKIFEPISFSKAPFVFIITNPVDVVAHTVQRFSGLPAEKVISTGTFLDSIRLEYYLSSITNTKREAYKALVVGEHGTSQVPIYSLTTFNDKPILNSPEFTAELLELAHNSTINAAFEIRKTQAATKYAVSKCAEMLFEYALGEETDLIPLSLLTNDYYRKLLNLDRNIYISLPVRIKNGSFEIRDDIEFSGLELEAYQKSAQIIYKNTYPEGKNK